MVAPTLLLADEDLNPTFTPNSQINSFELFWPVVAGKTTGDSFYSLKILKEKIRGFFIFGRPEKADYNVFLLVKRSVEAEKLLGEGKVDLANKTLDRAIAEVENARSIAEAGTDFSNVADEINNRLDNLEIFLPWLLEEYPDETEKLNQLLDSVKLLNEKV